MVDKRAFTTKAQRTQRKNRLERNQSRFLYVLCASVANLLFIQNSEESKKAYWKTLSPMKKTPSSSACCAGISSKS
jgi:hypothetical protein